MRMRNWFMELSKHNGESKNGKRKDDRKIVCMFSFIEWWLTMWLTFTCQIPDKRVVVYVCRSTGSNLGF
jgi:hypothetical protein